MCRPLMGVRLFAVGVVVSALALAVPPAATGQSVSSVRLNAQARQLNLEKQQLERRRVDLLLQVQALENRGKNLQAAHARSRSDADRVALRQRARELEAAQEELTFQIRRFADTRANWERRLQDHNAQVERHNYSIRARGSAYRDHR